MGLAFHAEICTRELFSQRFGNITSTNGASSSEIHKVIQNGTVPSTSDNMIFGVKHLWQLTKGNLLLEVRGDACRDHRGIFHRGAIDVVSRRCLVRLYERMTCVGSAFQAPRANVAEWKDAVLGLGTWTVRLNRLKVLSRSRGHSTNRQCPRPFWSKALHLGWVATPTFAFPLRTHISPAYRVRGFTG